jgi:nucleotide-binding universal stress UspA family protein
MKILVPIDYSINSNQALDCAIDICKKSKSSLHLISAYYVPRATSSFVSMRDEVVQARTEEMQEFITKNKEKLSVFNDLEHKLIEGDAEDAIISYAKREEIDLIIMGTKGGSSIQSVLLGSVTKGVLENSPIPVMAVPEKCTKMSDSAKVLLALDGKKFNNEFFVNHLNDFTSSMDLKLDVYHAIEGENEPEDFSNASTLLKNYNKAIQEKSDDAVQSIKKYAEDNDYRMVIMLKRKHSFIEKLFFKGHTSSELFKTNIPLLIYSE